MKRTSLKPSGLYDPQNEHDACGVGFVSHIDGQSSHSIVEMGLQVIKNLVHRGAVGGDAKTGDGAGIVTQLPHDFFRRVGSRMRIRLPGPGEYGVGMFFLPRQKRLVERIKSKINSCIHKERLHLLGWRHVPVLPNCLGSKARQERPDIFQCFVKGFSGLELERKLYVLRRMIEKEITANFPNHSDFHACSFSSRTITYKGLFLANQVEAFYPDLLAEDFRSAIALVHQRYSTNTFPTWKLAQPFRFLAHNGEINTLRGNRMQMLARERSFSNPAFGRDIRKLLPILDAEGSDSLNIDNALELLALSGRSLVHSMMMLVPEAWGEKYPMGPDRRAFFEYHAGLMEPWDGPAALAFTDGKQIGATLDRNGLRPARYTITNDRLMVMASETGVLDLPAESVAVKGALRPGEMILVDTQTGRVLFDDELKTWHARRQPYRRWIAENKISLEGLFDSAVPIDVDKDTLRKRQKEFGYTREDINLLLAPMAESGYEPVGSMGNDAPLAVLSEKPQLLFNYFKQLFAQVTNPPIDPIREELVMSTMVFIGNQRNILSETPLHCRLVKLKHPFLRNIDIERLKHFREPDFKTVSLPMFFSKNGKGRDLEKALRRLCGSAHEAVKRGNTVIILSDRGRRDNEAPIPALLGVAAVNHHLAKKGIRPSVGLIVETGEAREVMHMALLLGYGATAVNPYLALETIVDLVDSEYWEAHIRPQKAVENYIQALRKGLLKTMSKMGISTLRSYRGAQVFEALGLSEKLVRQYFTGTNSRIDGLGLEEIAREVRMRLDASVEERGGPSLPLPSGGAYAFRKDGERHLFHPETISLLQQATRNNDFELYQRYASLINEQAREAFTLRGMMRFKKRKTVPLDQVEPAEEIMKRFVTGAMSFGSLSKEAHETLAAAMNQIGGRSNSGEGGEDPERFQVRPDGSNVCSAIKQIASGRFGVTVEYLSHANELQIKIAQGAKPGEGGQLPGHKVNETIARVRNSTPGVTLISPPPHHDIYSIEDLAQLIHDLKCANPDARVSVKLVSEVGVGTVAAGVAKGKADMVLISGYDGGTGASPLSSIRHAGIPWELGLAETQQTLVLNGLRDRIRVQADGQMRTGRDVVVAGLLGAEEFGFATVALVVCGCVMMRKCHKNTCPMGVATQDPELRKRFSGKPEYLVNYFRFLAEDVRRHMASLGFRSFDELVGQCGILEKSPDGQTWKSRTLQFDRILDKRHLQTAHPLRCTGSQSHDLESSLDWEILEKAENSLAKKTPLHLAMDITNVDRSVGTILSGKTVKRFGAHYLDEDCLTVSFKGYAGQSFGAFLTWGITFRLEGEANDYLGKGLSGGKIVMLPPKGAAFDPSENIAAGNTLLYGATAGEVYICGKAGERFAVRNSGALAVVEGVGEHGCEYMTGGRVVVLGDTGLNFAAGMSGGIAYVYDENHCLDRNCNLDMVDLDPVVGEEDAAELHALIQNHFRLTASAKAKSILDRWEEALFFFVKVFPMEYKRVLGKMTREDMKVKRVEPADG